MPKERVQFVDSISDTAVIRLSLSDGGFGVLKDGTSLNPPTISRATTNSLMEDGSTIRASAYDNRVIILHLELDHPDAATAATQLQKLNRELDRPTNFLRYQPDPSIPAVYFRTFRAADYTQDHDHGINRYDLTCTIPAEPFALGLKEAAGTFSVSNNPANTGANGKFFELTALKGDVETPLQLTFTGSQVTAKQAVIGVRRRGTPSAMPFFLQAEAMTMGTDTTTQANNAVYSGSGNNSTKTTFATPSLTKRLSTTAFPTSPDINARGTYRVFARFDDDLGSLSTYTAQLRHGARGIINDEVTIPNVFNFYTMVDLGLIQLPEGVDPITNGPSGTEYAVAGVPLEIWTSRQAGAGQLICDYLLFMPADDRLCFINWNTGSPTSFVFDGYTRGVYGLDASGRIADVPTPSYVGDVPLVSPGSVTNRICYINEATFNPQNDDALANNVSITVAYWPRYLYVRPLTT